MPAHSYPETTFGAVCSETSSCDDKFPSHTTRTTYTTKRVDESPWYEFWGTDYHTKQVPHTKNYCCRGGGQSKLRTYPATVNVDLQKYDATDAPKILQHFPPALQSDVRPSAGKTCFQTCADDKTCRAGYTKQDNTCRLYKYNTFHTPDIPVEQELQASNDFVPNDAVDGAVFIKQWDDALTKGFVRPLVGDDWTDVRDQWVQRGCEVASQFANAEFNPNVEETYTGLAGEERDRFVTTCQNAIKFGSDGIPQYANRERDVGAATAVSAAINQLRANGRQSLDFRAYGGDFDARSRDSHAYDETVVPSFDEVIERYMTDDDQWQWRSGTHEVLGSETCNFRHDRESCGDTGECTDATKCANTPSTNASAYSPTMSFQNICRRIYGLDSDNNAITNPHPRDPGTFWMDALFKGSTDFNKTENVMTDILPAGRSWPRAPFGCPNDSFLCQFDVPDKDVLHGMSQLERDSYMKMKLHASLECEDALRHGAYQQFPRTKPYSQLDERQTVELKPALNAIFPITLNQKQFAENTMQTCALITNRLIDEHGLNMSDQTLDAALAMCYRTAGVPYMSDVATNTMEWFSEKDTPAHIWQDLQTYYIDVDPKQLEIYGADAAFALALMAFPGFGAMEAVGGASNSLAASALDKTVKTILGREFHSFVEGDKQEPPVTAQEGLEDVGSWMASVVASDIVS